MALARKYQEVVGLYKQAFRQHNVNVWSNLDPPLGRISGTISGFRRAARRISNIIHSIVIRIVTASSC
jgi:hypothetical protein